MCSHYQSVKEREKLLKQFGVEPPADSAKFDLWPGYLGTFIRKHPHAALGDEAVPAREAINGLFGLVPHWATDTTITKSTYNCRSETAAEKPSFRDAYKRNQRCIIPAEAIYEPDWRSGKAVATRIEHVSGEPLGIAGLWSSWKNPKNGRVHSFTMLTINADTHPLMKQFHKPTDEKRMVVILPPQHYQGWLDDERAVVDYMVPMDADQLQAVVPVPNPPPVQAPLL
jgi:putative SOS response-associated peptidase YedK